VSRSHCATSCTQVDSGSHRIRSGKVCLFHKKKNLMIARNRYWATDR